MHYIFILFKRKNDMTMEEIVRSSEIGQNSRFSYNGLWEFTEEDYTQLKLKYQDKYINDNNGNRHKILVNSYFSAEELDNLENTIKANNPSIFLDLPEVCEMYENISTALRPIIKERTEVEIPTYFYDSIILPGTIIRIVDLESRAIELMKTAFENLQMLNMIEQRLTEIKN